MRKFPALAAAAALAMTLTACGADAGDASRVEEDGPAKGVVTIQYDGKPLDCITWYGSHSELGMTCDFVKYHLDSGQLARGEGLPTAPLTEEEQAELDRLLEKAQGER